MSDLYSHSKAAVYLFGICIHLFFQQVWSRRAPEQRVRAAVGPTAPKNRLSFGGQSHYIFSVVFFFIGCFLRKGPRTFKLDDDLRVAFVRSASGSVPEMTGFDRCTESGIGSGLGTPLARLLKRPGLLNQL